MNTPTAYRSLVFGSLAVLMAGCASVSDKISTAKVDDTFKKGSSSPEVPNDIKGILVAGGLDAKNPSAPTSETKVAEIKPSKASAAAEVERLIAKLDPSATTKPVTPIDEHEDDQNVLMAALENKQAPQPDEPKVVAAPVAPSITKKDITPAEAPKAVALTSTTVKIAESEKALETLTIESKPQINTVTYSYPEIGVASLGVAQESAVEKAKATPKSAKPKKAGRVVSPSPSEVASIKKPRRF